MGCCKHGNTDGDCIDCEIAAANSATANEIDRLRAIEAAARNLCTVKGRHHSEIAMRTLMDACGIKTPNFVIGRQFCALTPARAA